MAKKDQNKTPLGWGARFRSLSYAKGWSLLKLEEKTGWKESTIRSWTNGTRSINLKEYLTLCDAAGIDPALPLLASGKDEKFLVVGLAWGQSTEEQKQVLITAAKGIIAENGGSSGRPASELPALGRRAGSRSRL